MKAIIYARTATRLQTESIRSIKAQVDVACQYAQANGFDVARVFTDVGFSGARLDRPALSKMRKLLAHDRIDAVIAYDLSLLTRSVTDKIILEGEFARRGAQSRYIVGNAGESQTQPNETYTGAK